MFSDFCVCLCRFRIQKKLLMQIVTGNEPSGTVQKLHDIWSPCYSPQQHRTINWKSKCIDLFSVYTVVCDRMGIEGTLHVKSLSKFPCRMWRVSCSFRFVEIRLMSGIKVWKCETRKGTGIKDRNVDNAAYPESVQSCLHTHTPFF